MCLTFWHFWHSLPFENSWDFYSRQTDWILRMVGIYLNFAVTRHIFTFWTFPDPGIKLPSLCSIQHTPTPHTCQPEHNNSHTSELYHWKIMFICLLFLHFFLCRTHSRPSPSTLLLIPCPPPKGPSESPLSYQSLRVAPRFRIPDFTFSVFHNVCKTSSKQVRVL